VFDDSAMRTKIIEIFSNESDNWKKEEKRLKREKDEAERAKRRAT
jgi:hypothetical protein